MDTFLLVISQRIGDFIVWASVMFLMQLVPVQNKVLIVFMTIRHARNECVFVRQSCRRYFLGLKK